MSNCNINCKFYKKLYSKSNHFSAMSYVYTDLTLYVYCFHLLLVVKYLFNSLWINEQEQKQRILYQQDNKTGVLTIKIAFPNLFLILKLKFLIFDILI